MAIAASLLPPVVNVGMSLAFAIAGASKLDMDATQVWDKGMGKAPATPDRHFQHEQPGMFEKPLCLGSRERGPRR